MTQDHLHPIDFPLFPNLPSFDPNPQGHGGGDFGAGACHFRHRVGGPRSAWTLHATLSTDPELFVDTQSYPLSQRASSTVCAGLIRYGAIFEHDVALTIIGQYPCKKTAGDKTPAVFESKCTPDNRPSCKDLALARLPVGRFALDFGFFRLFKFQRGSCHCEGHADR